MTNWVQYPTILDGISVKLISLEKEHLPELEILAKDKRIWEFIPYDGSDTIKFKSIYNSAIIECENGNQHPFVIYHKLSKRLIGSTRYFDLNQVHRKLEIGGTWIHPNYWATEVNLECKLLLLTHCFEVLKTVRVQLRTDENNVRSRKAIEKIGGQFEGILRNDMIRENHTKRNSAYFSIIDDEWELKKQRLTELLAIKRGASS